MAKEKSITELRDEKRSLATQAQGIIDGARNEKRQFTDAENTQLGEIQVRMAEINLEIETRESENRGKPQPHMPEGKFSFRRALVNQLNRQPQHDAEARMIDEATRIHAPYMASNSDSGNLILPMNTRAALTAATEATTGVVVDEDQMDMLLPLEPNLILTRAGARIMNGLRGNIYWPNVSAATVSWEGENDEAKDGAPTISKGTVFSPKRLTAVVEISRQLLVQENTSVEALVRRLLATAIAQKLEKTAFSKAAHDAKIPDGLFQETPEISGSMTWAQIVAMETACDTNNALFGNLAYLLNPKLIGLAKTKVKDASGAGGFIFTGNGDGTLNGYRALRSNNIPADLQEATDEAGAIFGNWADFFIGQWGAMDFITDPYTKAGQAMVRIIVNSYWNLGKVRDDSFVTASFK
jgi:HK97 family phage major capsid protein